MKNCLDKVPYRTGGCLFRSLRLSSLVAVGSLLEEIVRVSEAVLTGEVLHSCSGAPEVTVEVSVSLDETLCSGAWYHVGTFIPL